MSLVVADTGPINYLVLLGREDLLREFFSKVIVPVSVLQELSFPGTPVVVRSWSQNLPYWIEIRNARSLIEESNLGKGEREAVSLALELKSNVLLDDKKGRTLAERRGLEVVGTLGILEFASGHGLINLAEELEKLQKTSFRFSKRLIEQALARSRERKR